MAEETQTQTGEVAPETAATAATSVPAGNTPRAKTKAAKDPGEFVPTGDDIFDRLAPIIVAQLGVAYEDVTPKARFTEDLNADSLDLVELIMSIEEEFNLEISDEDAETIHTVGEAVEYAREHLE